MKKILAACLLMLVFATGCTNMSRTQQGTLSGAALGTAAGAGIAAIAGGSLGWGALAGAGIGAVAGGLIGHEQERKWSDDRW